MYEFSKNTKQGDYTKYAQAMYIDKTEKYYNDFVRNFVKISKISKHDTLVLNGKRYLNFESIWDDVKKLIEKELAPLNKMNVIHGDFCFSNILYGRNKKTDTHILKCIDPRGEFGKLGIYGDALYDSAKLLHSYEGGYEYIIFDEFYLEKNPALSNFTLRFSNDNKDKIKDIFDRHSNVDLYKAKIIEGLLFISMCSRHYDSEKRQLAMYTQGIKFLNEALEQ